MEDSNMSTQAGKPLDVAQRGPLQSAAFRDRLTGAATAFDGQKMREALQTSLLGKGSAHTIAYCRVSQAIYLPREDRCNLVYELKIRSNDSGTTTNRVICARIFSKRSACEDYVRERLTPLARRMLGREEIAPFASSVALLEPLHMAASVFPIDGDLPALIAAADPQRMRQMFREILPHGSNGRSVESCHVELVRYRARKRCVLRYLVEQRDPPAGRRETVVFGKVLQQPARAPVAEAMLALGEIARSENGPYRFHVPRPIQGSDPELALVEGIPGDPRRMKRLLRKRERGVVVPPDKLTLEDALEVCARIASVLHTSGITLGRHHTLQRELRKLRVGISEVEPFAPALASRFLGWYAQLEAQAQRSEPWTPCFSHGDFSLSQFLFDGRMGGLVDFDCLSQAEPARDVGHFLAYLRTAATRPGDESPDPSTDTLRERFLSEYISAQAVPSVDQEHLRARVALYEACTLLGLTTRKWAKFKGERLERATAVLDSLDLMAAR
jgi:hypothetical protein